MPSCRRVVEIRNPGAGRTLGGAGAQIAPVADSAWRERASICVGQGSGELAFQLFGPHIGETARPACLTKRPRCPRLSTSLDGPDPDGTIPAATAKNLLIRTDDTLHGLLVE